MIRRRAVCALPGAAWMAATAAPAAAGTDERVLRYAFRAAETTFDPAQIQDLYSRTITGHVFESPYTWDALARPARVVPLTALALPEASADQRTFTIRLAPGIFFTPHPAFEGKPRELTAHDYVYTWQRLADPRWKSPMWGLLDSHGILGLAEKRKSALAGAPFDYDAPLPGLVALDRHTLQIRLAAPRPRLAQLLASCDVMGAVAREVVAHHGDDVGAHPVGTGPFVLASWRRASRIELARNPHYRDRRYAGQPAPGDSEGQRMAAQFAGRRLPMLDRVVVDVIEEEQPRYLAFLSGSHNLCEFVPPAFVPQSIVAGHAAPYLAARGVQAHQAPLADVHEVLFNMEHPVVGGLAPAKVALRRAISLALDVPREIALVHQGQARVAQSPIMPNTLDYDPAWHSEMGTHDLPRAKALLDLYGYTDRNGDGWREQPDGSPLRLEWMLATSQRDRRMAEQYEEALRKLGVAVRFDSGQWPELLRRARGGHYMVWHVGNLANGPDSHICLQRFASIHVGGMNLARFSLPAFDALFAKLAEMPDGPERHALFQQASRLVTAYMPSRQRWHTQASWLTQGGVQGFRYRPFTYDWWTYVGVA